ncbi:hypothetical protein TNCV_4845151 [Trichonephila clavipes]|uniref:Uncharacterized protein n=1 Tax=Trichonephila clavipes TaxID=2585209 RepID=A0A8X6WJC2_TRICX|nr:hypothetical protein TNCV_4845151 [Trichonephila clavipes]
MWFENLILITKCDDFTVRKYLQLCMVIQHKSSPYKDATAIKGRDVSEVFRAILFIRFFSNKNSSRITLSVKSRIITEEDMNPILR